MEILCPVKFDFLATKWPAWKQRFKRFRQVLDLISKSKKRQLNILVYCMGGKSEDIFESFNLANDLAKKFDIVPQKFDDHFVIEKNVIFECAKFNMRCQETSEPAESFITTLHKLSEHCNYGPLHDELTRDRIVTEIRDSNLSEWMQLDAELTLEKAVAMVW